MKDREFCMDMSTDQVEPPSASDAMPTAPSSPPSRFSRLRRSKLIRLALGLAVLAAVVVVLAFAVLRILGPSERFSTLTLPYVQDFADVDPKKWFISDGVWSIREEMLAQAANLSTPASIYAPGKIAEEQPYHLSSYITLAKSTQQAGVNFNAQYPDMTERQHQVYIARRMEDVSQEGSDATAAASPMELVAGYTGDDGEFVKQVSVPFALDSETYRLDLYVLGNTYTVQINGQTMIERRPLFFPNGLVGYYTVGPARFDTLKITTAETNEPGDQVYVSDFDQQPAGAGWVPFSGEWEIAEGELVQANPAVQDAGIGYEGSAFEEYMVQATFQHLIGVGGGLLFNMVSPYQLNNAHVVRYADQTDSVFWGYFDEQGLFTRQGFLDVDAPGSDPRQLRVYVGDKSYDVYLQDQLLARDVPIHAPAGKVESGRAGGHVGLITSRSSVAFTLVEVFPLVSSGQQPLARPQSTAAPVSSPVAIASPAAATPSGNRATPVALATPAARATAAPLSANSGIIEQGAPGAWRSTFRGDMLDAGWRPLSGQWRFSNGSLVQEDATGFDLAIAYTPAAFRNYSYTTSFSHDDGNGAGVLFNMPYTDRLNGAHMVRYSDRRPGGIFWGYFDESGKFVGQGYANVSPPGDARHTLRVVSKETTYSVYLDDFLLAADMPLQQDYGYLGFVTVQSSAEFESAQIDGVEQRAGADQTPVSVQPLTPAGAYSGSLGFPEQRVVSGKWEVDQGVYRQTSPNPADYIFNTGLYASDYSIESDIFLPEIPEVGGGFMVQMPERDGKAGATVVRIIKGGQGVFWGVYDESGAFRGRSSVDLPAKGEGEASYRLRVDVRGNNMDVFVDDEPVIEGALLPRAEGWIGLMAFGGPVTFGNTEITIGQAP
jgi:hypothetical protein